MSGILSTSPDNGDDPKYGGGMRSAEVKTGEETAGVHGELYVAWTSRPRRLAAPRVDGARREKVDVDAVVVFGLADRPREPLGWLCDHLDRNEGDSRILHFGYHPSQVLTPGHANFGINYLAERLLGELVELRASGVKRPIIFFAFDVGCVVVKKALTIAAKTKSLNGEVFDACRTLVFFHCPNRSVNALDMEDKLARLLYDSRSQVRPHVAALPGLAASILEINESFIASKFLLRSYIVSIHDDVMLGFEAWRELEHHMSALGTPFEWRIFCHRQTNVFVSHLLRWLRGLESMPILGTEASLAAQFPKLPFDGERALLSLATPTEPFIVAGHSAARIELSDVYSQWFDYSGTQVLYVYSGKDNRELVRRTSEQVFYHLADLPPRGNKLLLVMYYSFEHVDARSCSLSSMLWTFLSQITSQFPEIRHFIPFMLDRLYEEQACTEADLLGWLEFFIARFDDIRLVINHFDDCLESSRDAFVRFVGRIAMKNDRPIKVFLTSRKPATLQAELSEWPSIDLDRGINPRETEKGANLHHDGRRQKLELAPEPSFTVPIRQVVQSSSTTPAATEAADSLALSILLEQHLQRNLTTQEILQETTRGSLEIYSLETVLDRILRSIPDQKQARIAVAFLLFATRPLSTNEFATLLFLGSVVDNGDQAFPFWDLVDRFERQRRAWFAGITVNKHSGIQLAHPRLAEVLRRPETPDSPRYFWHEVARTAHYDMAHICLGYLARDKVKEEQNLLSEKPFIVDSDLGFISYAVRFWPYHFSLAQLTSTEDEMKDLRRRMDEVDLSQWSRTLWLLSNPFCRSRNPWTSPIPALFYLGYHNILQPISPSDIALAIEEAARVGNTELVNSLLGAEEDKLSDSVLLEIIKAASSSGNESLTLELIDRLSPEGRGQLLESGQTLLFRAARLGLSHLVKKLIEIGVSVHPEIPYSNGTFATPLCIAAVAGHTSVVEILLDHGDGTEFQSHLQRTPLSLAASQGNADVIECLTKKGKANIEHVDGGDDVRKGTPLLIACEWGNPLVVEKLIELGADPNKTDDNGWAPILVAATFGYRRTVRTLLDHGVDIETPGPNGYGTALRYALANGRVEVFRMLLSRGANPASSTFREPLLYELASHNLPMTIGNRIALAKLLLEEHQVDVNATGIRGRTALIRACARSQTRFATFLLGYGADVNLADKNGYTPLFEATEAQNLHLVEVLLEKGADANVLTSTGELSLHEARHSPDLTRLLAERTRDVDYPWPKGVTPLMAAASKGWTQSVKVLLEHKANINAVFTSGDVWVGWTAVMFAAFFHYADILLILAEHGADLKKAGADGASALHLIFASPASENGREIELECLDVLLEFRTRINIDQLGENGETVLHRCAQRGHLRAVQKLVRAGANPNLQDKSGSTPLAVAVWDARHDVISYLLEHGADPNIAGDGLNHKEGPLHRACRDSDFAVAKMLVEHGADVNRDSVSGHGTPLMAVCLPYSKYLDGTDKIIYHLLELGVDVNVRSRYVGNPLAAAALACRPEIVRALLDRGAAYDGEDEMRRKPIHFAALNGEENFRIIEERVGNEIGAFDVLGRSVLHYAAQGGRLRVIKRIFELLPNLDVDTRDIDGWTPLCWVARGTTSWISEDRASEPTDPVGVVRYLLDRGADWGISCKVGDKNWTPLEIAKYTGAPDEIIALLKEKHKSDPPSSGAGDIGKDVNDVNTPPKGMAIEGVTCDACLWEIRGIYYMCKVCCDFALCEKCWPHRDITHIFESPHDFEYIDEEAEHNAHGILSEERTTVDTGVTPASSIT
ncbi:ankyrin repeat-containing domain protein [Xylaria bambusicola]|uniref:ankyrin repeat-containing domain protein n=1 Tax=Xylaria bambusicola TaxID=326684 RepID=UPI002008C204|nr:ankyrin repeat-containing domain protein [Xylaria bambusicola]KAI0528210.1 ankyrin repeat-containing domain protein [Xylaria bambusicola]